jgi:hypothetical protein
MNRHAEQKRIPNVCCVLGLARSHVSNIRGKGRGKEIPLQAHFRPWGFQQVEAPRFRDKLLHEGGKVLSVLRTSRNYPPGNIPGTYFC